MSTSVPAELPEPVPPHGTWELLRYCPGAVDAAMRDSPFAVVWHFPLAPDQRQEGHGPGPR